LKSGGAIPQDAKLRASIPKRLNARLVAWNPVTQREAWRVSHDYAGNGGVLATAGGLVFQSAASGYFNAYNAASGKLLWHFDAQATAQGGPISYRIGGTQFIAVAIGNGGSAWLAGGMATPQKKGSPTGRVLVFKLGGKASYPRVATSPEPVPEPPFIAASPQAIAKGARSYANYCAGCHGFGAISGQVTPDLRRSSTIQDRETFRAIVQDGALLANGMPRFGAVVDKEEVDAIRAYIASEARFIRKK
jgi:mono/diheme cytochrome c family protein